MRKTTCYSIYCQEKRLLNYWFTAEIDPPQNTNNWSTAHIHTNLTTSSVWPQLLLDKVKLALYVLKGAWYIQHATRKYVRDWPTFNVQPLEVKFSVIF